MNLPNFKTFFNFLRNPSKKFLGIDIGTSAIKIVELTKSKEIVKLENYGQITVQSDEEKPFAVFEKSAFLLSNQSVAEAINNIIGKAQMSTRDAFFSIPDFSTFFTFMELPAMEKQELASAIKFEARQHVPLPLSEVVLDWSIIENTSKGNQKSKVKILLVAVPYEIVNQYQAIAKLCQLRLIALEAEIFGLLRSLVGYKKGVVCAIDIGAQSTTINIVENGKLKMTHSTDISGNELTRVLSKSLNIKYNEAEGLKRKYGVQVPEMPVGRILTPLIDSLVNEINKIIRNFYHTEGKEVGELVLSGGSILLPGIRDYLYVWFKRPVAIGNPFENVLYPPVLEDTLKIMGPSYAIATGVALRGFEQ
ncbi:MAG: Type IV pilus assembly protein PilM [Parcubacteria group bacterium GW2011_GWC1_38_6]|nr:MAG: Type IV pilus assembly protein PilM [Parcubacteria group bacterium GW2011_GWC1_38_6]